MQKMQKCTIVIFCGKSRSNAIYANSFDFDKYKLQFILAIYRFKDKSQFLMISHKFSQKTQAIAIFLAVFMQKMQEK